MVLLRHLRKLLFRSFVFKIVSSIFRHLRFILHEKIDWRLNIVGYRGTSAVCMMRSHRIYGCETRRTHPPWCTKHPFMSSSILSIVSAGFRAVSNSPSLRAVTGAKWLPCHQLNPQPVQLQAFRQAELIARSWSQRLTEAHLKWYAVN